MKYFAYGSNMSIARLRERVPSAQRLGTYTLKYHTLRFHKIGLDGSGKCDAFSTNQARHHVIGAVFEMEASEKPTLDRAESLGYGYEEKRVLVYDNTGSSIEATTYYAKLIDPKLKPYTWYLDHVIIGAQECKLPALYLNQLSAIMAINDPDKNREAMQRAIHA